MSSKLYALLPLLVACSGSAEDFRIDPVQAEDPSGSAHAVARTAEDPATDHVEPGNDETGKGSPDASSADGEAPSNDAGDAGQDAGPEPARFGLAFADAADERVVADLPSAFIAGGVYAATWEGWFKRGAFTPDVPNQNGRLFNAGSVGCAVVTPDPVATEAGKVECTVAGAKVRSTAYTTVGAYFHVALAFDNGIVRLFLDGQQQGLPVVASQADLPAERVEPTDAHLEGHVFFGVTGREAFLGGKSGRVTVDEFRLTKSALYASSFVPQKHLTAAGSELLLALDDGSGVTSDSGKARVYKAAWVTVAR